MVYVYPFAFVFQQLAKLIEMHSPKSKHCPFNTRQPERADAGPGSAFGVDF
jgi:hypothetical protein